MHFLFLPLRLDSLTSYFHFLMAGLVSQHSPSMSSATLLAISRLCLEFKENLAGSIVDELLSTLTLVLQSKERQIVQAALSFCRVLLIIVNETVLSKYIEQLVSYALVEFHRLLTTVPGTCIDHDARRQQFHISLQTQTNPSEAREDLRVSCLCHLSTGWDPRTALSRFDVLRDLFPDSFHPQMSYINKMRVRKERRRKGTSTIGQSVITKVDDDDEYVDDNETTYTVRPKLTIDQLLDDSDDDNEQDLGGMDDARSIATARTTASVKRRRQQQSALWIKETHGDDPIDLTEPAAARSIYGECSACSISRFCLSTTLAFSYQAVDHTRNRSDETSSQGQTAEFSISYGTRRPPADRCRR